MVRNLSEWAFPPHLPTPVCSSGTLSRSISSLGCPFSFHPQYIYWVSDTVSDSGDSVMNIQARSLSSWSSLTSKRCRHESGDHTSKYMVWCCHSGLLWDLLPLAGYGLHKWNNNNSTRPCWYVLHINILSLHSEPTKQIVYHHPHCTGEIYSH